MDYVWCKISLNMRVSDGDFVKSLFFMLFYKYIYIYMVRPSLSLYPYWDFRSDPCYWRAILEVLRRICNYASLRMLKS